MSFGTLTSMSGVASLPARGSIDIAPHFRTRGMRFHETRDRASFVVQRSPPRAGSNDLLLLPAVIPIGAVVSTAQWRDLLFALRQCGCPFLCLSSRGVAEGSALSSHRDEPSRLDSSRRHPDRSRRFDGAVEGS